MIKSACDKQVSCLSCVSCGTLLSTLLINLVSGFEFGKFWLTEVWMMIDLVGNSEHMEFTFHKLRSNGLEKCYGR